MHVKNSYRKETVKGSRKSRRKSILLLLVSTRNALIKDSERTTHALFHRHSALAESQVGVASHQTVRNPEELWRQDLSWTTMNSIHKDELETEKRNRTGR